MEPSYWPGSTPSNRIKANQELTKGQILMLDRPENIESNVKSANGVTVQILGMFDKSLSALQSSNLNQIPHNPSNDVSSSRSWDDKKSKDSNANIKTMTPVKTKRGCYKRRKNVLTITKVTSTLIDDGYGWRKYGQKVILNSKHQRAYYRCTHKFEQGCQATKQVQMTDNKPSKYKITYHGFHTCNNSQRAQIIVEAQDPRDNSVLINFERNLLIENTKVGTCIPSMEHTSKECFPSLGSLKQEQVSSIDHRTPWDPIVGLSEVSLEAMSMMSWTLDDEYIVSSGEYSYTNNYTHGYEVDDVIESHDYGDFLFELW